VVAHACNPSYSGGRDQNPKGHENSPASPHCTGWGTREWWALIIEGTRVHQRLVALPFATSRPVGCPLPARVPGVPVSYSQVLGWRTGRQPGMRRRRGQSQTLTSLGPFSERRGPRSARIPGRPGEFGSSCPAGRDGLALSPRAPYFVPSTVCRTLS
jgi:hypothetical protein